MPPRVFSCSSKWLQNSITSIAHPQHLLSFQIVTMLALKNFELNTFSFVAAVSACIFSVFFSFLSLSALAYRLVGLVKREFQQQVAVYT